MATPTPSDAPDWRRALLVCGAVIALLAVVASTFYVYISSLTGEGAAAPAAIPTSDGRGDEGVGDSVANGSGGASSGAGASQAGGTGASATGGSTNNSSAGGSGTTIEAGVPAAGTNAPERTNMDGAAPAGSGGRQPATGIGIAEAKPGPIATSATPTEYVAYTDPRYGFEIKVPKLWRPATLAGDDAPIDAADYDVVFEDPQSGARLAASLWSTGAALPLNLWVMDAGRGMDSVDGVWPTNGQVAGAPALVLWAPETPTLPARYAAFLVLGREYWRLAYSARDGGDGLAHFLQLVASFSPAPSGVVAGAPDTSPVASSAGAGADASGQPVSADMDLVPPLPRPEGRYFPSSKLYRR